MRVLLVYCHPSPTSYVASIREALAQALAAQGHVLDVIDLYAEGFAPVLAKNGGGGVVNVLSVVSLVSFPSVITYSASKAAATARYVLPVPAGPMQTVRS